MKIVLAHGILGFGGGLPFGIGYFNGVKRLLEQQGHEVFAPTVSPLASLDVRSDQLARQIEAHWPGDDDLAMIGHSMGGLDARRVIHRQRSRISGQRAIGERIKLLVTVGTPHFGSPVADAVLGNCSPLLPHIPRWLLTTLQNHAGALPDLATRQELHDPDCDGVTYLEIACVRPAVSWLEASPLFGLSQAIGKLYGPNDGLVTRESACLASRQPLAEWPTDHTEAIGWPTGYAGMQSMAAAWKPPVQHLERFHRLAERIATGRL